MRTKLGTEQEKLAVIEGILAKAVAACDELGESAQRELATQVVQGLRMGLRRFSYDQIFETSPFATSIMEEGTTDEGTLVAEWATSEARACIFIDRVPEDSLVILLDGRGTPEAGHLPESTSIPVNGDNVGEAMGRVTEFMADCLGDCSR